MLTSKLPHVGTTIFTVMSELARETGAINLSQGFPDFDAPAALLDRVQHYLRGGHNQYAPMMGMPALRQALADKVRDVYGLTVSADSEVTVTSGATEALFCAIAAVVRTGDEVILFDPAYDSYEPAITLQGGCALRLPLQAPDFRPDWQRFEALLSPRTRLVVINTPHNPTGTVWSPDDLLALQALVCRHGLYVVADEVYEHIVFDGMRHESVCRYPDLYARSFVVSSLGKTYHVTGWKIGYCVAPPGLTLEFRRIHQYVTFTSITPVQLGLADYLVMCPEHHLELGAFYQRKRDLFAGLMGDSRFSLQPSKGTYFQMLDYSAIVDEKDTELARRWTREVGVASIPLSVFYAEPPGDRLLRFCFAKSDDTLRQAAERLCRL
ncbi:MAG: pyridoxal phosphate-dependent aminotransferase [Pseudomonadales bacterium]